MRRAVVVELVRVTKTYGAVRALVDVSCRFTSGTATVVRGPNGSGKSTLLAVVGTLAKPTIGRVSYGELGEGRTGVRSTLGWVGHDSLCYPDLTGRQNVELAARLQNRDPAGAYAAARDRFELGAFAERQVRTYSRGQRQRIALARALVHEPCLILLDEPTTGLDRAAVKRLVGVVLEEVARGAVVVVVSHDGEFAEALGGRVVTLERGRRVTEAGESE